MSHEIRRHDIRIVLPDAGEAQALVPALGAILADCVAGGASVSFMHPFTQAEGEAFFTTVAERVRLGATVLFVAFLDGEAVGTVHLTPVPLANQPHRAEVNKLLVHRRGRRLGVAERLMRALEEKAADIGRTLLCLDTTAGGGAERLYEKLGWRRLGIMPGHALMPDGTPSDTTFFWKALTDDH